MSQKSAAISISQIDKHSTSEKGAETGKSAQKDSLLKQINMVDERDVRLRRLHLFLSQENIERA